MFSKDEFNEKTKCLKDKYVKLFSNTMLMGAELDRLSSKSNTELLIDNDEIFILEPDNGFSHMYCVIPAADAAARIKTFSSEKHLDEIVFDLTGRSKGVIKMAQELCELGIEPYAKYNRFTLSKRKKGVVLRRYSPIPERRNRPLYSSYSCGCLFYVAR